MFDEGGEEQEQDTRLRCLAGREVREVMLSLGGRGEILRARHVCKAEEGGWFQDRSEVAPRQRGLMQQWPGGGGGVWEGSTDERRGGEP